MFGFLDTYKKTGHLHHAHVICGTDDTVLPCLIDELEKTLGVSRVGNPDFSVETLDLFGVDEARAVSLRQSRASWSSGGCKVFIIRAAQFTREAQNALLKTFEEPTEGTHFFLIIPHADILIPTLRSRVMLIDRSGDGAQKELRDMAESFLQSSLSGRFTLAKKIGEMHDREKTRVLLGYMESMLSARGVRNVPPEVFQELFRAKTYITDRGSSPKMLMEHLAIVLG